MVGSTDENPDDPISAATGEKESGEACSAENVPKAEKDMAC
jgi:hypothetical protein